MVAAKKDGEKEKEAKVTPQKASKLIMDYLVLNNRPYSPNEVSGNVKVPLTMTKKLLKDMHERQEIACQVSGKQQVYYPLQEEIEEGHSEKLQAIGEETKRLTEHSTALKAEEKELRTSLKASNVKTPLPQLKADIESKEKEKTELALRLTSLRSGTLKPVSAEERDKVTKTYKNVKKAAVARKRIRGEVWNTIVDVVGKDKAEETKDQLGLEF